MNAPRVVLVIVVLLIAAPITANAQEQPPVTPGDRVRVTAPGLERNRLVGSVYELRADSVVIMLEKGADPFAVSLADLTKVEVSHGRKSKWSTGALVGFVVAGVAAGVGTQAFCTTWTMWGEASNSASECLPTSIAAGALGGFFVGVPLGALIGSAFKTDRWEEVPLDGLRMGPSPVTADGVAVSVSLSLGR